MVKEFRVNEKNNNDLDHEQNVYKYVFVYINVRAQFKLKMIEEN